jgi:hypothetical protein
MRRFALVALALALAACESPTGPSNREQLLQARARWSANGSDSYSFEINRGCFCVLGGRLVEVTVQDGAVVSAQYLDSKGPVEPTLLAYLPTVPDLFDLIQDAIDRQAVSFDAGYDPLYGYPTSIAIDYSATTADDELSYTARALTLHTALSGRP